ncbi:MAG: hypothetical protein ACREF5_00630 [Candidatus Saccharimonadales bacterium]
MEERLTALCKDCPLRGDIRSAPNRLYIWSKSDTEVIEPIGIFLDDELRFSKPFEVDPQKIEPQPTLDGARQFRNNLERDIRECNGPLMMESPGGVCFIIGKLVTNSEIELDIKGMVDDMIVQEHRDSLTSYSNN